MNACHDFSLSGVAVSALASGALWLPEAQTLCVSDLHLGKSDRIARRSGFLLPPYETRATLDKIDQLLEQLNPRQVICLGDSFDDLSAAESLDETEKLQLTRQQAGRDWVWIEGNHDPGPVELGGRHVNELTLGKLVFRHIAIAGSVGEVSGHYHPKCNVGRGGTRPAFLADQSRIIMPAFGAFTGGLRGTHPTLRSLMAPDAIAVLTGKHALPVPFAATT